MNVLPVILILISAFMHASWNLLARRTQSEMAFFKKMLTLIALVGLAGFVPSVIGGAISSSIDPIAWLFVTFSGMFCGLYFYSLARSYRLADFTTAYPLTRALPVLLVGFGDIFRGEPPSVVGWMGMLIVGLGCLLSPLYSFHAPSIRSYVTRANFFILLTALGTVGYTLIDKTASDFLQKGPATAAAYGYVFFLVTFVSYTGLAWRFKIKTEIVQSIGWLYPLLAACLCYGAYWLVLWAYQLSSHASYVLSFRQSSIAVSVIPAFYMFKTKGKLVRITAVLLITIGLLLIGFGGGE